MMQNLANDMLKHINGENGDSRNGDVAPVANSKGGSHSSRTHSKTVDKKSSGVRKNVDSTPFTHVIFDMDGLLLNTEDLYTEVYQRVAAEHNCSYTWEMKVQLMGRPAHQAAQMAVDLMKLPITVDEFSLALKKHQEEVFPTAKLLPGVEKLVHHLLNHDVPISIASGSTTKAYNTKTTNHKEFFDLFPIVILGDNPKLKQGKPAPDQFLLTASKFFDSPSSDNVLVFEDSPNGVLAARAAGMGVILVPDERLDSSMYHNPTQVLKSLLEFEPELYGFPPYDSC